MKITVKSPALVLLAVIIAGAASAALGYTALRLARYERGMRNAEIKTAVSTRAELLSRDCRSLLENFKEKLTGKLVAAKPTQDGLSDLCFSSPFIANAFIADKNGNVLMPEDDQVFRRRYYGLFFEAVSNTHREDFSSTFNVVQTNSAPPRQNSFLSKTGKSKLAPLPGPTAAKPPRLNGDERMTSRFGRYVAEDSSGWIPWFSDNLFCPILWVQSSYDRNKIVGAELETVALQSRIYSLMPQNLPGKWRLELVDGTDRLICVSDGSPGNPEGTDAEVECVASYPVWREDFPGWRVRACLLPGWDSAAIFTVTAVTQVLSLFLIIVTAGLVMFYLMQRELRLAGQKTSFVANVSHELKTPLTSIRMYAEMLIARKKQLSPKKEKRYLAIILSESERLSRLITNVLDFSRTEAGRKKYHKERFSVTELIREVNEIWSGEMEAAGLELRIEVPAGDIPVYMDRDALFQTLHNLLSNALKYAASGGEINLVSYTGADDNIIIEVRDRGPGIPAKAAKRIFNKFYRCDNSLTAESSGSGLGLAIARRLITDQGGTLVYLPREGGGAIFRITLGGCK
jgi:signal transduction histidine kinase